MKKLFIFLFPMCCAWFINLSLSAQTSEVYSYISNYVVNTGTGEKKQWHTTLHFYCRFNSDKSICYETNDKGELHKDLYPGDETKFKTGWGTYKKRGCDEYVYYKTENGVKVYKQHCRYYKHASHENRGTAMYPNWQWEFWGEDEYTTYIYFSPDYSKMNEPRADNEVFTYDRIFPDKTGSPTQIW